MVCTWQTNFRSVSIGELEPNIAVTTGSHQWQGHPQRGTNLVTIACKISSANGAAMRRTSSMSKLRKRRLLCEVQRLSCARP